MNWSLPLNLSNGATSVDFNASDADGFCCTAETTGLDQAPIRATVEDRAQTHGGIVHDAKKGPRRITIVAQYLMNTTSIDDRDDAIEELIALLDSLLDTDGTLTQTTPGGDRTLTVRAEINLVSSGGPQAKQVLFGLVAADPDWSGP